MASRLEVDLSCSICREIFTDPVVLTCKHSFCEACLKKWWQENQMHDCPLCKRRSSMTDPPVSLVIRNMCESVLLERDQRSSAGSEPLCRQHGEKLKLFCLNHQQPVCLICRDSEKHIKHRFRPINEAAQQNKQELQESLKPLKEKLKLFKELKGKFDQEAKHIKGQAQYTERLINEEFKKLHKFLQEEEEARMAVLREEEEQKSQTMQEKIEALSREIAALSDTIRATEEELRAEDVSFLLNYKAAVKRVQQRPLLDEPQLDSGALIDLARHLGNLSFTVWNKMKEMVSYTPVVLDLTTVKPTLIQSEDLTTVRYRETRQLPDNPEGSKLVLTLGSEGFNSGTHSWDVEVGDNAHWALGVLTETSRKKWTAKSGFWRIVLFQGKYTARFNNQIIDLEVKKKPQRVRVHLDWNKGKLSFFDPDCNVLIHTFTHTFTERLFPVIGTGDDEHPVKILTSKISVSIRQQS